MSAKIKYLILYFKNVHIHHVQVFILRVGQYTYLNFRTGNSSDPQRIELSPLYRLEFIVILQKLEIQLPIFTVIFFLKSIFLMRRGNIF
jgi:hypothetical protein